MGHTITPAQYHGSGSPRPQRYSLWLLFWFDVHFIFYFAVNCPWISVKFWNDFYFDNAITFAFKFACYFILLSIVLFPLFCSHVPFYFQFWFIFSFIFFDLWKIVKFWVEALDHHTSVLLRLLSGLEIYVIRQNGGPYWEKLCPRPWYTRQRAQFFPIRTDLGWWITFLFFSKT